MKAGVATEHGLALRFLRNIHESHGPPGRTRDFLRDFRIAERLRAIQFISLAGMGCGIG